MCAVSIFARKKLLFLLGKCRVYYSTFSEDDNKGGYLKSPPSNFKLVRQGLGQLKNEFRMWGQEWMTKLKDDPPLVMAGSHDFIWKFNNSEMLDKWVVTADSDHNEGYSRCEFLLGKHKTAVFQGTLSTQRPETGDIFRTGYCNIRSMRPRRSFKRDSFLDWHYYTHLLMRIRGDGRSYMLNLHTAGYFDVTWNDMYNYVLYTRGGPYWQDVKIPFSKFFLSHRGYAQDKQAPIPQSRITNFGITCADKVQGPFYLEIDYIGVYQDPSHKEEFAYEMYEQPPFTAGN